MPRYERQVPVNATREQVWDFVCDVDRWADLFPGYQRHVRIDEDRFTWQIRGEAGVWSRLVEFDVEVQTWNPPTNVVFELTGKTEPVQGLGTFRISDGQDTTSTIGFELTAEGKGPTAPMLNSLLDKFLSEQAGVFLTTLAEELLMVTQSGSAPAEARARTDRAAPTAQADGEVAQAAPPDGDVERISDELEARSGLGASAAASAATPGSQPITARTRFPTGPGVIVVTYQAPSTAEFENWMHGAHYDDLLCQPGVIGVTRFERIGVSGPLGSYLALIRSEDLATTMRYRTTVGAAEMAEADRRGVVRGEWYWARTVYDRRVRRVRRFLRRVERYRRSRGGIDTA